MNSTSAPTTSTTSSSSSSVHSSSPGPTPPPPTDEQVEHDGHSHGAADTTTTVTILHSDSNSSQSNPQSNDDQYHQSSSLVVEGPTNQSSSNDVVNVNVAHSDFSLVSQNDFHIAPGQFRMALEEAAPPVMTPGVQTVGGDNSHALNSVVPQTVASDNVVPNGVHVHASVQNGDSSPSIVHSAVPYLESNKAEGLSNPKGQDGANLPHVSSLLQAGSQIDTVSVSQQQSRNCPTGDDSQVQQQHLEDSASSSAPPTPNPVFIVPQPPTAPQHHQSKQDVRAVDPHRFKAQEAKEREERVRKRLAAGLPAEDPGTPTGAHAFLLSPSASMTSGGRPSSAMSSSMMSEGSGVFSSDLSVISRSSSMFSLDSSTGGSIGPLEPGALKVRIICTVIMLINICYGISLVQVC